MKVVKNELLPESTKEAAKVMLSVHRRNAGKGAAYAGLCCVATVVQASSRANPLILGGVEDIKFIIAEVLGDQFMLLPSFLRASTLAPYSLERSSFALREWWLEIIINEGRAVGFTEV